MRPVWAIAGAAATKSAATKAAAERNVFESRIACISLCPPPLAGVMLASYGEVSP